MNKLQRAVQRREAIRQAAIVERGWGRDEGDNKLSPEENWEHFGGDDSSANRACIEIVTEKIEAYERVMAAPYVHGGEVVLTRQQSETLQHCNTRQVVVSGRTGIGANVGVVRRLAEKGLVALGPPGTFLLREVRLTELGLHTVRSLGAA